MSVAHSPESERKRNSRPRLPADERTWWTVREAGDYADVHARLIYSEIRAGRLRAAIVGGRRAYRLRREWIDAWLEASAPQEITR